MSSITHGCFEELMPPMKTLCKLIMSTDFRCYRHHSASHFTFCNLSFLHLSNENKNICSASFIQLSQVFNEVMNENALVNHCSLPLSSLFTLNESLEDRDIL